MSKTIIDFEKKGNVVRFYLGEKDPHWGWTNKDYKDYTGKTPDWLEPSDEYYGDDWDDTPYEHNAGTVYPEFIKGTVDIAFDYDDMVIEPSHGYVNSKWCKDDMIERKIPCLIVIPKTVLKEKDLYGWNLFNFEEAMEIEGAIKYYFGDPVSDITYGKIIEEDVSTETELPLRGNYRLEYIYHIQRGELPASEGLAVEKRADDGSYFVISFIRYDIKEKSAYFDVVSKRLINIAETEWPDVLELMKIGTRIVELENKKEE